MDQVLKLVGIALLLGCFSGSCQSKKQASAHYNLSEKIAGVNFVNSRYTPDSNIFAPIRQLNAGWVSLIPYAFTPRGSAEVVYDTKRQWRGETTQGIIDYTALARKQGLKIMLKPHLWLLGDGFTGKFSYSDPKKQGKWAKAYKHYIMHHARLADSLNIELLCIGTELETFVKKQPLFWQRFIKDIRAVYKGKLTYAANWDEYKRFPYWAMLDYIGIDAYFPLSKAQTPNAEQLKAGWQPWLAEIQGIQKKHNKPVLFTEFGYRSINQTAAKPWVSDNRQQAVNLKGQANALNILLQEFMPKTWFAGGFAWKWFDANHHKIDPKTHTGYSPQNKPAEKILKKWYAKTRTSSAKKKKDN